METILIVDLEATCWDDRRQSVETMEIIEFGCVLADLNGDVLDSLDQFVRPKINPQLSVFCRSLTSIEQKDVANASFYPEAVIAIDSKFSYQQIDAWASWGNYDYRQIEAEKNRWQVAPAFFSAPHINLKACFKDQYKVGRRSSGLADALSIVGFSVKGRQHRALEDAMNITRLIPHLVINSDDE